MAAVVHLSLIRPPDRFSLLCLLIFCLLIFCLLIFFLFVFCPFFFFFLIFFLPFDFLPFDFLPFDFLPFDFLPYAVLPPEVYPFALQSYSAPSTLKCGHLTLSSQVGPQQGDPLGPVPFSLPLQPVLQSLESALKVGFMDDLILGGETEAVARDVVRVAGLEPRLGLHLNPAQCEIVLGGKADVPQPFSVYIETP